MASGVFVDIVPGRESLDTIIGHTLKAALFTSSLAVPSFASSAPAYGSGAFASNEVASGGGYTTGGKTLTTVARSFVGLNVYLTADDLAWSSSTITARYLLVYDSTTSNYAVVLIDFGADFSSSASTFPVNFPSGRVFRF